MGFSFIKVDVYIWGRGKRGGGGFSFIIFFKNLSFMSLKFIK